MFNPLKSKVMIEELQEKLEHFTELSKEEQKELKILARMMGIEVEEKKQPPKDSKWWSIPFDEAEAEKAETVFCNTLPERPKCAK